MDKNFIRLTEETIRNTALLHSDISAALMSLPSIGWKDTQSMSYIQTAHTMLDNLQIVLQQYINIGTQYQKTLTQLLTLLEKSNISDCVSDLVAVRRNARRYKHEKEEYRVKLSQTI